MDTKKIEELLEEGIASDQCFDSEDDFVADRTENLVDGPHAQRYRQIKGLLKGLSPQGREYGELPKMLRVISEQSLDGKTQVVCNEAADAIERLSVGTGLAGELRERPNNGSEVLVLGAVEENDERGAIVVFNDGVAQLGKIHAPYSIIRAAHAPEEDALGAQGWVGGEVIEPTDGSRWIEAPLEWPNGTRVEMRLAPPAPEGGEER